MGNSDPIAPTLDPAFPGKTADAKLDCNECMMTLRLTKSSLSYAHPEHYVELQVEQLSWPDDFSSRPASGSSGFFSGRGESVTSWSILIFVAPTVMAMAIVS